MAVPAQLPPPLTSHELAQVPSRSLPLAAQLEAVLDEFTALSLSLFAALSSASVVPTLPIYTALSQLDRKLVALLQLVDEHRRNARRVEHLVLALRAADRDWTHATAVLHDSVAQLTPILRSGARDRELIAASAPSHGVLTPATILSYARSLAPFTSAPPTSLFPLEDREGLARMDPTGRGLPSGAIPPFPTEGVMRRGRLQFGGGDVGELGEVGARKEQAQVPPQANALAPQDPATQLQQHAQQLERGARPMAPPKHDREDDEFEFDLDLNPDL